MQCCHNSEMCVDVCAMYIELFTVTWIYRQGFPNLTTATIFFVTEIKLQVCYNIYIYCTRQLFSQTLICCRFFVLFYSVCTSATVYLSLALNNNKTCWKTFKMYLMCNVLVFLISRGYVLPWLGFDRRWILFGWVCARSPRAPRRCPMIRHPLQLESPERSETPGAPGHKGRLDCTSRPWLHSIFTALVFSFDKSPLKKVQKSVWSE